MSSSPSNICRRSSMAHLYEKLQSQPDDSFDWLAAVACDFPTDEKSTECDELPAFAPSPFTISSGSSSAPSAHSPVPDHTGQDSENDDDNSDSDDDSDIEPITLDHDTYASRACLSESLSRSVVDPPFMPSAPLNPPSESASLSEVVPGPGIARARSGTPFSSFSVHSPTIAQPSVFRRSRRQKVSHSSIVTEDQDAVGESDGDATDDEYIPSPPLNPRKRTRSLSSSPQFKKRKPLPQPVSTGSSTSNCHASSSSKRPRLPPPSRNKQTSSHAALRRAANIKARSQKVHICPECGWRQENGRGPDFKRHLRTHTRVSDEEKEQGWWCQGVPVADATMFHVPEGAQPYMLLNQWRIGGCGRSFSRKDALRRHLQNPNINCVSAE